MVGVLAPGESVKLVSSGTGEESSEELLGGVTSPGRVLPGELNGMMFFNIFHRFLSGMGGVAVVGTLLRMELLAR